MFTSPLSANLCRALADLVRTKPFQAQTFFTNINKQISHFFTQSPENHVHLILFPIQTHHKSSSWFVLSVRQRDSCCQQKIMRLTLSSFCRTSLFLILTPILKTFHYSWSVLEKRSSLSSWRSTDFPCLPVWEFVKVYPWGSRFSKENVIFATNLLPQNYSSQNKSNALSFITMRSCTRAHPPAVPNRAHSPVLFLGRLRDEGQRRR